MAKDGGTFGNVTVYSGQERSEGTANDGNLDPRTSTCVGTAT